MDANEDSEFATYSEKFGNGTAKSQQENFVNGVYASVDEAVKCEINRLHIEEDVTPSCKSGCFHCCGQHILTNIAEAQALAHYIKCEFSKNQIEELRIRTQQWHEWDESRRDSHIEKQFSFPTYHYCPMLVKGKCSAYPVRPLICRTHYVCSEPPACNPCHDPHSIRKNPVALASIVEATNPISKRVRDRIETAGLNFCDSIMLLPHWLAIEMKWSFAILPQSG